MFDFGIQKIKAISVWQIQITMKKTPTDMNWDWINPLILRSGNYFSTETIHWEWTEYYKR